MPTPLTPRFTLPDPDRDPMTPLPAELLARILRCAQEGQTLEQQLKTRLNFEKVCKSWFECEFRWKVVVLFGFKAVQKFVSVLSGMESSNAGKGGRESEGRKNARAEDVAGRIRAIKVELRSWKGRNSTSAVRKLLPLLKGVHTLELVVDKDALKESEEDCLCEGAASALAKLTRMRYFTLTGLWLPREKIVQVSGSTSQRLIPNWPRLESVTFNHCFFNFGNSSVNGVFNKCTQLHSLDLDCCDERGGEFASLLAELPSSTRELRLKYDWRSGSLDLLQSVNPDRRASEVARTLRIFAVEGDFEDGPRGALDDFIAQLDNVVELTINPALVSDLGRLTNLKSLSQLKLVLEAQESPPLSAINELALLMRTSASLKRVTISPTFWEHWSTKQRQALRQAASNKIKIGWTDFAD